MIDEESLSALDAMLWLRTGNAVSQRFGYSLSLISRRCRRCLDTFNLTMQRVEGEWCLVGDDQLLQLQRHGHQLARWQGRQPLRLEATYWSGPLLCTPTPEPWLLGEANIVGVARNLQLLRERIVDAFVAGLPDIPEPDDADLTTIVLSSMPVFFVARADHPLAGQANLTLEQIARYPSLALPEGSYPRVERSLRALGLWSDPGRMQRYRRELWEGGASSTLTIAYGTPLTMAISGGTLVRLPLELPFRSGEALVVRREFADHPQLVALRRHLLAQLRELALTHPDLQVLDDD